MFFRWKGRNVKPPLSSPGISRKDTGGVLPFSESEPRRLK